MQKKTTDLPLVDAVAAAQLMTDGGILAYPTEGVFGIGCDPRNAAAIQRLLAIKARDPCKGLILIAANLQQLSPWVLPLSESQLNLIDNSWPGPVTWVVPARADTPSALTGGRTTVAVRVTAHPPVIALCLAAKTAIVSTSANLSGEPPARSPEQVRHLSGIDACLDAPVGKLRTPTPIYNLSDGAQLRS